MKAAVVTGDCWVAMEVKDMAIPDDLSDGEVLVKNAYSAPHMLQSCPSFPFFLLLFMF